MTYIFGKLLKSFKFFDLALGNGSNISGNDLPLFDKRLKIFGVLVIWEMAKIFNPWLRLR